MRETVALYITDGQSKKSLAAVNESHGNGNAFSENKLLTGDFRLTRSSSVAGETVTLGTWL